MIKIVHVAVGVIVGDDGRIFIAKRPDQTHQGGLWEFPGGKVEAGETLLQALTRELKEELAIDVVASTPLIKIRHDYGDKVVLLDVHKVTQFVGAPKGNEGQPVCWVAPQDLLQYEFPAANRPIITAINLPQQLLITGDAASQSDFLAKVHLALDSGIRLIQLRMQDSSSPEFLEMAQVLAPLCQSYSARLQLNTSPALFLRQHAVDASIGLHLNSYELQQQVSRPVGKDVLLSASCHNQDEIEHARNIDVDFILLSPVQATTSHPNGSNLGWAAFSALIANAAMPVYALGGLQEADLPIAIASGAQGIAAITAWWD